MYFLHDLAGLSMLITAIAGVPAAIMAARNSGKTRRKIRHELNPNHGSSMRDQVDLVVKLVGAIGHQVGEFKQESRETHQRYDRALERLKSRMDHLETNRKSDTVNRRKR